MFASLVGNDYVSSDALEPFTRALSRGQYSTDRSSRKEARFAGIAKVLSTVPDIFVLHQMVSSYGGVQLKQAVEHYNTIQYFLLILPKGFFRINLNMNYSTRVLDRRIEFVVLFPKWRDQQFSYNPKWLQNRRLGFAQVPGRTVFY